MCSTPRINSPCWQITNSNKKDIRTYHILTEKDIQYIIHFIIFEWLICLAIINLQYVSIHIQTCENEENSKDWRSKFRWTKNIKHKIILQGKIETVGLTIHPNANHFPTLAMILNDFINNYLVSDFCLKTGVSRIE